MNQPAVFQSEANPTNQDNPERTQYIASAMTWIRDLLPALMLTPSKMAPKLIHLPTGSAGPDSVSDSRREPIKIGIINLGWRRRLASMNEGKETVSMDCNMEMWNGGNRVK